MGVILRLALSISLAFSVLSVDRAIGARKIALQQPPAAAQKPPTAAGEVQAAVPEAVPSSKVWIGRYAEYEEFLRTAVIDRATATGHAFFKPGGLAASAALKRHDDKLENAREIAGYKLDRVLGLDMVPPTVEVRYNGEMAALQLWVLNTRLLKRIDEGSVGNPDPARWNYQLHRAYAFEDLVANLDVGHEGSPLIDPQGNLILLDHSRGFTNTLAQPYEIGKKLNQIDRVFFDRIKALDKATVKRAIGDLVDAAALDALFARRDNIVKAFEKLAAQQGANQVFTP
ncbi:MAG TPA: hypothetical protein VGQ11_05015 [Candidatus Acidoferrales bacterium]|nr:hypothetical protein [Candidatus Acidoferrales bacterium]